MVTGLGCLWCPGRHQRSQRIKLEDVIDPLSSTSGDRTLAQRTLSSSKNRLHNTGNVVHANECNESSITATESTPEIPTHFSTSTVVGSYSNVASSGDDVTISWNNDVRNDNQRKKNDVLNNSKLKKKLYMVDETKVSSSLSSSSSNSSTSLPLHPIAECNPLQSQVAESAVDRRHSKDKANYLPGTISAFESTANNTKGFQIDTERKNGQRMTSYDHPVISVSIPTGSPQHTASKQRRSPFSPSRRVETSDLGVAVTHPRRRVQSDDGQMTEVDSTMFKLQNNPVSEQSYNEDHSNIFRPTADSSSTQSMDVSGHLNSVGAVVGGENEERSSESSQERNHLVHFRDITILQNDVVVDTKRVLAIDGGYDVDVNEIDNDTTDGAAASLPSRPGTDHGESKPEDRSVATRSDSIGHDTISTKSWEVPGSMIIATHNRKHSGNNNNKHLSRATRAAVAELDDIVRSLKDTMQESNLKSIRGQQKTANQNQLSPSFRSGSATNLPATSPTSRSTSSRGSNIKNGEGTSPKTNKERNIAEQIDITSSRSLPKTRSSNFADYNNDDSLGLKQRSSHGRIQDSSSVNEMMQSNESHANKTKIKNRVGREDSPKSMQQIAITKTLSGASIPKTSQASYVDVLASSWDTETESDDEKASLYNDDGEEGTFYDERALSRLPSDTDPQVRRRYLAACQLLKDTLISNKQVDLSQIDPDDRELLGRLFMSRFEHPNESPPPPPPPPPRQHTRQLNSTKINHANGNDNIDVSDHTFGQMSTSLFSVESVFSSDFYNVGHLPNLHPTNHGLVTSTNNESISNRKLSSQEASKRSLDGHNHVGERPTSPGESRMSDVTPLMFNGRNPNISSSLGVLSRKNVENESQDRSLDAPTKAQSVVSSLFGGIEEEASQFLVLGTSNLGTSNLVANQPTILTTSIMEGLRGFLPYVHSDENFYLKFSSQRDGHSLSTLLHKVEWCKNTIIAIETTEGDVFGAYCSSFWRVQPKWYGSVDSFLWRLRRKRGDLNANEEDDRQFQSPRSLMKIFPWTGHDNFIQFCTKTTIAIGGGGGNGRRIIDGEENKSSKDDDCPETVETTSSIGLLIDGDLMGGETNPCATFANTTLLSHDNVADQVKHSSMKKATNEFEIRSIEVWTMTPCLTVESALELENNRALMENHAFL